jgi:hypothetical protein
MSATAETRRARETHRNRPTTANAQVTSNTGQHRQCSATQCHALGCMAGYTIAMHPRSEMLGHVVESEIEPIL